MAVKAQGEGYGVLVLADHGQHTVLRDDGSEGETHETYSDEDVYDPLIWGNPEERGRTLGIPR